MIQTKCLYQKTHKITNNALAMQTFPLEKMRKKQKANNKVVGVVNDVVSVV